MLTARLKCLTVGETIHRLFELDERLASLFGEELSYKSISVRIGASRARLKCLLPPSATHGFKREWRLHFDDCFGRFERLPYYAVDKLIAAHDGRVRRKVAAAVC